MACGTGKTRVMKELVGNVFGKASWCLCIPSRVCGVCLCWTVETFAVFDRFGHVSRDLIH